MGFDDQNTSETLDPREERVHSDNYVLNELKRLFIRSNDVFGKNIADSTRALIDIASHYDFSPERLRVYLNGNRQYIQYGSISQYTDTIDEHVLQPSAGDTVSLRSTDDVIYQVQYELSTSWAFAINQALQSGDRIRIGLFDASDGWFFEQNDTHATDEGDFIVKRNGSEVVRDTHQLPKPTTDFYRWDLRTAWYRVTRQQWTASYQENGRQKNPVMGRTSTEPDKGPQKGNFPLRFQVTAGSGTSNLELHAGSMAAVLLGETERITRAKNYRETFNVGTTGTYIPVVAFRKDPDRAIVRAEFTDTNLPKFTGSGDIFALLVACGEDKVLDSNGNQLTDSNFNTPNELNPTNSVIETTTDVAQFPDNTGTPTTSTSNPGGYQLGLATRYTSGSGGKVTASGANIDAKRVLASGDYAVLVVKAEATGDFDYEATIEQDF